MAWMLSGEAILLNVETRMVFNGSITFWTDNKSRSMMIFRSPVTGNEERLEIASPREWWIIQHQMQIIEEMYAGTPMLDVQHTAVAPKPACDGCAGSGGDYDHEGNWIDCPACTGVVR